MNGTETESPDVNTVDVPQADNLRTVRAVVEAVAAGTTIVPGIAAKLGMTTRHARYCLHSARVLGWIALKSDQLALRGLEPSDRPALAFDFKPTSSYPHITGSGEVLLSLPPESAAEAAHIAKSIQSSYLLQRVAGDILNAGLDEATLARRISVNAGLAASTARRRAQTLLAWAEYVEEPASSTKRPGAPTPLAETLDAGTRAFFERQVEQGRLVLALGRSFSKFACNRLGEPVPSDDKLKRIMWPLAFPNTPLDATSELDEIVQVARRTKLRAVRKLLTEQLSVDRDTLPDLYRTWYSFPWRRIVTTAVDDLDVAAGQKFNLSRKVVPRADDTKRLSNRIHSELEALHVNGRVTADADGVCFANTPHTNSSALTGIHFTAHPVVYVSHEADATDVWELLRARGSRPSRAIRELRPKSFLVAPCLSAAREQLLSDFNVVWIESDARQFAEEILEPARSLVTAGFAALGEFEHAYERSHKNIRSVADLVGQPIESRSEYLLGAEPTWDDLLRERAIEREADRALRASCAEMIRTRSPGKATEDKAPLAIISGTAGSGKSTSLMRIALWLSTHGNRVAWVGAESEVSPRQLGKIATRGTPYDVVAIDDADRYGNYLANVLHDVADADSTLLILVAMRSSKLQTFNAAAMLPKSQVVEHVMPPLSDADISDLIGVLDREHRLGRLKGVTQEEREEAFREEAGRQLLVAMIQATSGRKFDAKVVSEWSELPDRARTFYTMIAIATSLRHSLTRKELLVAASTSRTEEDLQALEKLSRSHIIATRLGAESFRARHRLIGERLIGELAKRPRVMTQAYTDLAFAIATSVTPDMPRSARPWRLLKSLLNHNHLYRLTDRESARNVYEAVQDVVHWDYHYWLQRGSLEVEWGDLRLAEQFLDQAFSLNENHHFVRTEYAYLLIKKACYDSAAPEAEKWLTSGVDILRDQVASRGSHDSYPYHVLGAQSLNWVGAAPWSVDRKQEFLRGVRQIVKEGVARHPRSSKLIELERDVLRSQLDLKVIDRE